jgi:hypothetical protein
VSGSAESARSGAVASSAGADDDGCVACDCGIIVKDGGRSYKFIAVATAAHRRLPSQIIPRFTACNMSIRGCSSFGVRAEGGGSFVMQASTNCCLSSHQCGPLRSVSHLSHRPAKFRGVRQPVLASLLHHVFPAPLAMRVMMSSACSDVLTAGICVVGAGSEGRCV